MRILQICKKMPYPTKDGESIAIFNLTKAFHKAGHETTILAMNTKKHHVDWQAVPEEIKKIADFQYIEIDTNVRISKALLNLFSNRSYHIERFISNYFEKRIIELLEKKTFDIIQLEGLYLSPYIAAIRKHHIAPIILRAHNIEFEIWERIVKNQKFGIKKSYLSVLAKRLKKYEIGILNKFDAIVPITRRDAEKFKELGCSKPIFPVPTGMDFSQIEYKPELTEYPSVFMLGSMDWIPNQEGLDWFLKHVWNTISKNHPTVKFYIAGRNIPKKYQKIDMKNVIVVGEVENAADFVNSKSIMVVPLFSGSGMRIKIVEGMSLGKTIISTSIGAEGINYSNQKNIIIADSSEEFINALLNCINDKIFCETIGKNARQLALENYDNQIFANNLIDFYKNTFKICI